SISSVTTGEASQNLKKQVLPLEPSVKARTLPALISEQKLNSTTSHYNEPIIIKPASIQSAASTRIPTKSPFATLPSRTTISRPPIKQQHQGTRQSLATNAFVKQIKSSFSTSSLSGPQIPNNLSLSTKDLRHYVSKTYTPEDSNTIDDNGIVHLRNNGAGDQSVKRQQRLSRSFHNVSDYHEAHTAQNLPSKSCEDNLDNVTDQLPP
ncbi:unnamed protein product, partial [Didymodactylos carnosus]